MGEAYTICDPYLFTIAQWLEQDGVDPSRFPKVVDHRRRTSERPEVRNAIAEELACIVWGEWTPRVRLRTSSPDSGCHHRLLIEQTK